tara:strand:- start:848 stop:1711 length:864 start_codon:yes stop_codon:yes gene_type:complete
MTNEKSIIFIADFLANDPQRGGAELHDKIVIEYFKSTGTLHEVKRSTEITIDYVKANKEKFWFISNFVFLSNHVKAYLSKHCQYVIYEHDYKFCKERNPIKYKDFKVPESSKINVNFFRAAKKVICLSKLHYDIFDRNLDISNLVSIKCSMWSDEDLEYMKTLQDTPKKAGLCAIINSTNPIKKTPEAISFCDATGLEYELIQSPDHREFLKLLSQYEKLVFMTGHPEPTPRVAIEAKMLNCTLMTQKHLIGVSYEDYFHLTGDAMIEKVRTMRDEALEQLEVWTCE